MAAILYKELSGVNGITITQEVQANGVFAIIPKDIISTLQKEFFFYVWDENKNEVRWMTSWDTQEEDIKLFTSLLKQLVQ